MPTNEAGLVWAIEKAIAKRHPSAWVTKIHGSPYQAAGIPDLLVCIRGRLVGIEVKFQRPGESRDHALRRTSLIQEVQMSRIIAAGGVAGTVVSVEEALGLIDRALSKGEQ